MASLLRRNQRSTSLPTASSRPLTPLSSDDGSDHADPSYRLMSYTRTTVRIGPDCRNDTRDLLVSEMKPRSLNELVRRRVMRDTNGVLYGEADRPRSRHPLANKSDGPNDHVKHEQVRRKDHRDLFAETQLRLPDFIMETSKKHMTQLLSRYRESKTVKETNKIGKDDIHLASILALDFDDILIDWLYEALQKSEQKNQDLLDQLHGLQSTGRQARNSMTQDAAGTAPNHRRRRSSSEIDDDDNDQHYDVEKSSPPKRRSNVKHGYISRHHGFPSPAASYCSST